MFSRFWFLCKRGRVEHEAVMFFMELALPDAMVLASPGNVTGFAHLFGWTLGCKERQK